MNIHIAIILATIVNLISCPLATLGQNIVEQYSTADQQITSPSSGFNGEVNLLEIGFKNSENDYLIFRADSSEAKINLKGLQFHDDKDFKIIDHDFWVDSGSPIKLTFNSNAPDSPTDRELFSAKNGLTSTTEQILIHLDSKPLAFFCWVKSPIAKSEIAEFSKIYPEQKWDDADIENCFPSDTVKNDQIITRIGNENNIGSWAVISESTPANNSDTKATNNTDLNSLIENAITNESPDMPLILTEISPAPKNKEDFEWIELFNSGVSNINLDNWIIDDSEGGSKPKRLAGTVAKPGIPLLINLKDYKINLNNDQDTVRLFAPDGTAVIEQDYDNAQKGSSYSLINIDGDAIWQWTETPSPAKINPNFNSISGTVILPAQFDKQYFFGLEDENQLKYLVTFDEAIIKAPLAQELFQPGTTGTFTGQLSEAPPNNNDYIYVLDLSDYQLGNNDNVVFNWPPVLLIVTIPLLALGIYLLVKKQKTWNPLASDNL